MKRPALDYYGGKWKHANEIIKNFPAHKSFVEVFCGAASITLRKPRSKNEIINDIHNEVVNFFYVLRDRNMELKTLLEKTPYSRTEYLLCRTNSDDSLEQARRTVVKSWFGIGDSLDNKTGFRVSLTQGGSTTAPWLKYTDYLHLYAERLRGVIIENLDYREILRRYDRTDTLFYMDPPYVADQRSKKHAYLHDWNDQDHNELLNNLKNIKGKVVLSGYDTNIYDALGYEKKYFVGNTQSANRIECLWIKETTKESEG